LNIDIIGFLISFGFLLMAMVAHEFSHGWVAYKLGDSTAKYSGRLTLNPLAHIDPIGTVLLPLLLYLSTNGQFVFGAAKPVPINYQALKNPKRDIIWIGASGPLANFILALFSSIILRLLSLPVLIQYFMQSFILINVVLGVFNLIPIPPFDGSRIVMGLLPENLAYRYGLIEPFGFFIVMALIWFRVLDFFIWPLVNLILNCMGVMF
jgi:Zn-dependent protease